MIRHNLLNHQSRCAYAATALLTAVLSLPLSAQLVPFGSTWKYLDDGSDQGTSWVAATFDDSQWNAGPAQLGYGDGDESTALGYGPDSANKFATTYFRHTFTVIDPTTVTGLDLDLVRDDGAVV